MPDVGIVPSKDKHVATVLPVMQDAPVPHRQVPAAHVFDVPVQVTKEHGSARKLNYVK